MHITAERSSSHKLRQYVAYTWPRCTTEHISHMAQLWVKYCGWRRTQTNKVVALVAEAEAELHWRYILPSEQKSMPYKRKVLSSIYSKPSKVNNGQIMNLSSLKKDPLKKRDWNEGRQCTRMASSISQRNREQSDRLYPFPHTRSIPSALWVIRPSFPRKQQPSF